MEKALARILGQRRHTGRLPGLILVFLCAFFNQPAYAQVWRLDTSAVDDVTNLPITQATLDLELLHLLSVGDNFDVYVDSNKKYNIRITDISVMSNGDRRWYGSINNTGLDYSLVITAGTRTAHLILTSPSGIFQLYGTSTNGVYFKGRFNRLEHVRDEVAITDTVLPPPNEGSEPTLTSDPFTITQSVSRTTAPVGSSLTFDLTITNNASTMAFGEYVDIFFVLENTDPEQLPGNCEILQSTQNQPVLSCDLGDFNPGETKQLSYTVSTSMDSHPLVYSTATVGEIRSDVIVELYRDVVTDSDADGTSDYNELLLGTDPLVANEDMTAHIDVLVAYTPEIADIYLGEVDTRINQLFNVANKIFADSRAGIVLRPVGSHVVDYEHAEVLLDDLNTMTFRSDPAFNDLSRLRGLYGGDLVVLFRTGEVNGLCGLANLGGKGTQADLSADYHKDFAYSVINIDCHDDSVLAHELGHNLGLVHSRREDEDGGTLPYSAGFGEDDFFVTVMAFPDDFNVVNRLYRFSDPQRACGQFLCGSDREDLQNGADAVTSMKLVKHQVASYYPSQESRIATLKTVSSSEGAVDAAIGVGAYAEGGTTFKTSFSTNDAVNLRLKITPLSQHIGKRYTPHLVILGDKQYLYQATASGEFIPWNGALASLVPSGNEQVMTERELLDVVEGVDLGAIGLLDTTVRVYIAYRLVETGELVYGVSPFSFRQESAGL